MSPMRRRKKQDSRDSLLAAATQAFCAAGCFAVSVEDVAAAAGVSRMTFYRHFSGKAAIATELFRLNAQSAMPRILAIGMRGILPARQAIAAWIGEPVQSQSRQPAAATGIPASECRCGPISTQTAHEFIADIITGFG